jgi:hypothetical protein
MEDGVRRRVDELRGKRASGDPPDASDVQKKCDEFLSSIEKEMTRPPERHG